MAMALSLAACTTRLSNAGSRSSSQSSFAIATAHGGASSLATFCNRSYSSYSRTRRSSTKSSKSIWYVLPHATTAMSATGNIKPLRASQQPPAAVDPLRSFPWEIALKRFAARLTDLVWTAFKWLTIPTLLVSSASELSYTLVHGKLLFVPFAMFLGIVLAGVAKETAIELSPGLQKGFPWHLLATGLFFALIKLPGPAYPFWGRIILPHFANGGLWQVCYSSWQGRKA